MAMDFLFKPIVLVTGFGPFKDHPVNASWEAVKLMNKEALEDKFNFEMVTLELPVTYENVDEFVPALWETHEPKLMIHVGVSSQAKCLTIETQAHKKGYQRMDYLDKCPANHACPADGAIRLHTRLNVDRICEEFNGGDTDRAVASKDAGRYLCEYIYYTSLSVDNSRTLFVHVPDTNISPSEEVARGLERVLEICWRQVREADGSSVAEKLGSVRLENGDDNSL